MIIDFEETPNDCRYIDKTYVNDFLTILENYATDVISREEYKEQVVKKICEIIAWPGLFGTKKIVEAILTKGFYNNE